MATNRSISHRKILFIHAIILSFCLISLAGCSGTSQPIPTAIQTPAQFDAPLLPTSIADVKPAQQNLVVIPCDQPGQVRQFEIQSENLNDKLAFSVYFPPCYGKSVQETYPSLYLLHGQTFDQTQWQRLGITQYADQFIRGARTVPFLIIMPFEQYFYRSPQGNKFPIALIEELLPWVEQNLHAEPRKPWRALGGISRGASWAMRLGLQRYDLFGAVGGHSLPTFNGDLKKLPEWLDAIPNSQSPRIYIDIGRSDPEVKTAIKFELALNQHGIPHEWHLNEGHHDEEYWGAYVQEYLDWYTLPWRILPSQ